MKGTESRQGGGGYGSGRVGGSGDRKARGKAQRQAIQAHEAGTENPIETHRWAREQRALNDWVRASDPKLCTRPLGKAVPPAFPRKPFLEAHGLRREHW